ncbi:Ig-like domain-containing protein, partial [Enterobacter sp. Sphag1F]
GVEIGRTEADAAGNWEFTPVPPLLNGDHEISAKAQDKAGNISDESNSIGFDLLTGGVPSAPAIVNVIDDVGAITGNIRPGGATDDTQPTIVGTAKPGHIVTILIDGQAQGTVVADSKGQWSFTPTTALPEGPHAIVAAATDPQGNPMPSSGEYNIVVDTTAPDVGSQSLIDNVGDKVGPIVSGDTTDDSTPTYSGVAEPGSTVIIKDGDREIGRVPANSKGEWSFTPATPLPDGPHSLSHQVQDPAGNLSAASTPIDFVVDTSAVVVSITNVFDDAGSVTGTLNTGSVTDDTTPTLNGRATANALVTIKNGTEVIGSVYADARGNWQFTPTVELKEGDYNFTASAEAKNGSVAVSDKFELTIDITPPDNNGIGDIKDNVGGIVNPIQDGGLTDDTTPELGGSGQEPGDVVTIIDNGKPIGSTVVGDDGSWSYTPETPLSEGSHDFTIIVTDPAGNDSQESDPWTVIVDTKPPVAPSIDTVWDDVDPKQGDVASNGYTNDQRPELRGSAAANAIVIIYQNGVVQGSVTADASGKWKWTPSVDLSDATFNFTASQVSAAGVEGDKSAQYTVTVDTLVPSAPLITSVVDNVAGGVVGAIANGGLTNDSKPTLSGTAEPNALVKILDGNTVVGSVYATATGAWSLELPTALPDGTHTLTVTAEDRAGNVSPQSNSWGLVIDTVAPNAPVITSVVDNVPGGIVGAIANGGLTNDNKPTLSGTAEPNALVKILDGNTVVGSVYATATGAWSMELVTALPEGSHTLTVTAQDSAGNVSPQSGSWVVVVDTVAPTVPVITSVADNVAGGIVGNIANGGLTNDNRPTVTGTAEANSLVFLRDGTSTIYSFYANGSGTWSFELPAGVPDGNHSFSVVAQDGAGNTSGASNSWSVVVDTVAPTVPVITSVADNVAGGIVGNIANGGLTNDNRPTLTGTAEANSLVFLRDGTSTIYSFYASGSGTWSFELPAGVPDGNHSFSVVAQDGAGNTSGASNSWSVVVDTVAPTVPVITSVADNVAGGIVGNIANGGLTNDNRPTLTGTAEANSLVFLRDGTNTIYSFYASGSGNWTFELPAGVPDGNHSFSVVAQDGAGNTSGASNSWNVVVDTVAPAGPQITNLVDNVTGGIVGDIANGGTTNDNKPTLSGTTEPNALITIRVDNVVWGSVRADGSGKWQLELEKEIPDGSHEIRAFAEDGAGNVSAQSNLWTVVVDTQPFAGTGYEDFTNDNGVITGSGATKTIEFSSGLVMQGKILNTNVPTPGVPGAVLDSIVGVHNLQRLMQVDCAVADIDIPDSKYISFLYSYNNYAGTPQNYSFSVYDTNGNILDTKTFATGANMGTYSYQAPEGVLIGKVEIVSPYTLSYVDNIAWGDGPGIRSMADIQSDDSHNMIDDGHVAAITSADDNQHDGHQTEATVEQHGTTLKIVAAEPVINFDSIVHEDMNIQTVDMTNSQTNVLNITLGDVLAHGEEGAFTADDTKQLMIKGDEGDVVNLSDLLPDGTDPGNWAKAEGTVTVSGVQYEVYQHTGAETELLVQLGVQTNLNNH